MKLTTVIMLLICVAAVFLIAEKIHHDTATTSLKGLKQDAQGGLLDIKQYPVILTTVAFKDPDSDEILLKDADNASYTLNKVPHVVMDNINLNDTVYIQGDTEDNSNPYLSTLRYHVIRIVKQSIYDKQQNL